MTAQASPTLAGAPALPFAGRSLGRSAVPWLALLTMGVLAALVALLIAPGRSFVGIYVNDLMVFYDGAHRILSGQIPNRDFHTPLGPLAYLLPAFGLWAGGSLGRMIPLATGLFALMLAAPLFYVSATRLPFRIAVFFVLYVAVLVVAPVNPGDSWPEPTFAMFYNRFGWATLTVLLAMALPRMRDGAPGGTALDAACAGWLVLLLFYLKLSYAAVGFAALAGLLALPQARRFAALALLGAACAMLAVEAVWRATGAYLADAISAAAVSGAVRGGAFEMATLIVDNMRQLALYGAALALGVLRGTRPIYLLGSLAIAALGLVLLNQNAQATEIPVLLSAMLVAALGPVAGPAPVAANAAEPPPAGASFRLVALLLVGALATPGIAFGLFGLRHFRHELRHTPSDPSTVAEYDGIVTHEGALQPADPNHPVLKAPPGVLAQALRTGEVDTQTMNMLRQIRSHQPLAQTEYLDSLADGAAALRADPSLAGPVYTYDLQNPFNAMLGRSPPRGDSSWNHYGRTFNEHIFLPPQKALADVQVVMDPKDPMELYSELYQKSNYARYLASHFELARETTYWRIYRRTSGKALP
jgi:hypothetical protein